MTAIAQPSPKFWDRVAAKYAKSPVPDQEVYERKLEITRALFRPDMDVLALGCGTGSTAIAHAPHVRHIRAVDISDKMLDIARAKADAAGVTNVDFERAAIEELTLPNEGYDLVMAHSLLHLLPDKEAALEAIFSTLKPGGAFVSSTACIGDTQAWLRFILPIGRFFGRMPFVEIFTTEQLVQSIEAAGFVIDQQWQPAPGRALFIVARKP